MIEEAGAGESSGAGSRRIGVYVCGCGGNISDYVSVDDVVAAVKDEPGVVVARTAMFTCSDATQQEIISDIQEQNLDGIVVASCSPKLHTFTFREMSKRAGLNPYEYTQVNIREQCSWTHTDDAAGATGKAARLVRAGIARTRLTQPLESVVVETIPKVVVIGGGIAGMRAALGLAEIGLAVFLVEKETELGGWVAGFADMYPHGKNGRELVTRLEEKIRRHQGITVFTNAEVVDKSGSFGNYEVSIQVGRERPETITVEAGSIVVATGFDSYAPQVGEFGYGLDGVLTLPEFKRLVDASDGPLAYHGKPVRTVAYIYCVGSRQAEGNEYCSRYCCTAAIHSSLQAAAKSGAGANGVSAPHRAASAGTATVGAAPFRQYHLYRDIRSYGKYELLYNESREKGDLYLRFPDDEPPVVAQVSTGDGAGGGAAVDTGAGYRLTVTTRDLLTGGEELMIPADLVVLVTGMVPRENDALVKVLKLPIGNDAFFNEIHPKLRPVETVVDGVFICGVCQSPKNSAEAVASALAAVTQSASILKRGYAELDPLIAVVDPDACEWCGLCLEACPYEAPSQVEEGGKVGADHRGTVAVIDRAACKGCGGCVPVCPKNAIDLLGYTDAQMRAMIDGLLQELTPCQT
ncbi:MAG: CoB--CoM heterodisulfide reductase iron-sulfur subunit A family protein [Thermoleophilia bacterium]|nr:CoB--CoM heterodisulfide reductase iron-sulfur subunit A family protein [Thermoleophilia bacterium]